MKIVVTGGHLSPALAVIDLLKKDFEILVIGRKYALEGDKVLSLEYETMIKSNISFKPITSGRLQRKWTRNTLFSIFKLPYGFFQSLFILKNFSPDAVLSFGGYVSFPVTVTAFILRIPVVIHEQTLEAGMANKIASLFAEKVCVSWETSREFFPKSKTVLTGNPIRAFKNEPLKFKFEKEGEDLPLVYITGGTSGSHAINILIEGCIKKILEKARVIHQTGDAKKYMDFDRLQKIKKSLRTKIGKRYVLTKFIEPDKVGSTLVNADLAISRSGMNTVMELAILNKPSLLIPLPFSQNNEQMKNALFLKSLGLAEVVSQNSLTSDKLYKLVLSMIENKDKYKPTKNIKKIIRDDAAKKIVEIVKEEIVNAKS